ncbi:MAG: PHP domain-containing protein [Bacilli bacterium]|nr:PHP domain-containing protein [Bacilli bacterium]
MIDLHIHTYYSDGSFSVKEVLEEANKLSLKYISITDHNVVDAYDELKEINVSNLFNGEIINGCEITTTYNGEVIEVLGYDFDIPTMKELLKQNVLISEQKQLKEFELIKKRYKEIGVIFNEENIVFNPKKESCRSYLVKEIKRYPENYKFFLEKSSIDSKSGFTRNEAFNPKSPLYVDESSLFPSLDKAIDIVHKSGGLCFLAHTFAYSPTIVNELDNIINNYEFDGIECYYTTFTEEQTKFLLDYCSKHNLFMSGGSDFHGNNKINHNMGIGSGNMNIHEHIIKPWHNNK